MKAQSKIVFAAVVLYAGSLAWTNLSASEREHASNRGREFLEEVVLGISPIAKKAFGIQSIATELSPEPSPSALTGVPNGSFAIEHTGSTREWQDQVVAGSSQALPEGGWQQENRPYVQLVQTSGQNWPEGRGQEADPSLGDRSEPHIFDFAAFLGEWVMVWPRKDINRYNWLRIDPGRGGELDYVVSMGNTRFGTGGQGLGPPTEEIEGIGVARQEKGLLRLDVRTIDEAVSVRGVFLLNGSQMDGNLTMSKGGQRTSMRVKWARCRVEYHGSPRQWDCY